MGEHWSQEDYGMINITIPALKTDGNCIFSGTYGNGIFISTDNGLSWNKKSEGLTNYFVKTIDKLGSQVYVGTEHGDIYLSSNNGMTWQSANTGTPSYNSINDISIKDSSVVFATTTQNLLYSSNSGSTWEYRSNGITASFFYYLAQCRQNIFVIGSYGGIFKSTDEGLNWTHIELSSGLFEYNINCLAVMDTIIFAGSAHSGVYRSFDFGTTWDQIANLPGSNNIRKIVVSGSNLFAFTLEGAIYISYDKGETWILVSDGLSSYNKVSVIAVNDLYLYAGMEHEGIWRRPFSSFVNIDNNISTPDRFSVFPNPASEFITINYKKKENEILTLNIYNSLGVLVSKGSLNHDKEKIEISNLNNGIYFVEIKSNDFRQVEKLIVNK